MEQIYALGVTCIEFIQHWFHDSEEYFTLVNHLSNPHHAFEILLPLVSVFDSVFGAQFLLCMAFGSWLNAVMKWWLLEERPYWWVRETTFYRENQRPSLVQYSQTCETGPGCPSGHTTIVAMELLLIVMWIAHIMNDRKYYIWWWKIVTFPICAGILVSTMLARMFVATHFPHQCVLGAGVGLFLAPALCIYVSDPYIWGYCHADTKTWRTVFWHTISALITIAISALTYWSLKVCGVDPQWSNKLAYKWCDNPENIHVSTTPLFALVQSTGSLLGWALAVTPVIAKYRHYTRQRSLLIALFAMTLIFIAIKNLQDIIDKDKAWLLYTLQFILYAVKPFLLFRVVPWLAMWPYAQSMKEKTA